MRWFGSPWPSEIERAPVCNFDAERVPVPVGMPCPGCGMQIVPRDRGVLIPRADLVGMAQTDAWHLECFVGTVTPL